MPANDIIKERVLRLVQPEAGIVRRHLLRKFNTADRARASEQISVLLSEGVLMSTGIGRRGSPEVIQRGVLWPKDKCPFCHQVIP